MSTPSLGRPLILLAFASSALHAQRPQLSSGVRQYVVVDSPVVIIRNVRVIDGTGAAPRENQTVVIRDGRIAAIGAATGADRGHVVDGTGKSLIPGFVMLHEHLFYPVGQGMYAEQPSFPRLYLGVGITTARTGGSMDPYADIHIKRAIDGGRIPGPSLDVTAPYINGPNPFTQMAVIGSPEDARRHVNYWADAGATSFKAYMQISRAELRAAVEEAHRRGMKITGHLCSVTFREAAEIGIDNLEHGLVAASDVMTGKRPDACPGGSGQVVSRLDIPSDTTVQAIIRALVERRVALTSTLAVFEVSVPGRPSLPRDAMALMTAEGQLRYLRGRLASTSNPNNPWARALKNEMIFEKMFADAGGLLVVGTDPTSYGGVIAGPASQMAIKLLVEAGFTPVEAIRIATLNGATYLGRADRIGTIAVGKNADLVLIDGNPAQRIDDIERVEIVFKDGVGYDAAKLVASARATVGN